MTPEAQKLYDQIAAEFVIEDAHAVALLRQGCEAYSRALQAGEAIKQFGVVVRDRWDQPKTNPACAVERDAVATMRSCFRQLGLDAEQKADMGRPPQVTSIRAA